MTKKEAKKILRFVDFDIEVNGGNTEITKSELNKIKFILSQLDEKFKVAITGFIVVESE